MNEVLSHRFDGARKVWLWLAFLSAFPLSAAAQITVSGYTPPTPKMPRAQRPQAERIASGELPLSRRHQSLPLAAARSYRLPALPPQKQKQTEKRLRIGVIRPLPQPLTAMNSSSIFTVPEGRLAVLRVAAEKAQALKLHFTDLDLPPGARLYVYAAQNADEVHGPYRERGPNRDKELWTPLLKGEEVIVELFLPAAIKPEQDTTYFRLVEVSHIFKNPRTEWQLEAAANCNQSITPEWNEAAKSTGLLQFRDRDGEYACTGTLLNTSDNSGTPYVLTANHCIGNALIARSVDVYWLYDQPTPSGQPDSTKATFGGATLLATNETNDFTLMRLNNNMLPTGVRFSGWSTAPPAIGAPVAGIHHPQNDYKRLSLGQTTADSCAPSAPGALCDNFLKVRWNTGITEPGSSGSGLYVGGASDPKLVGILSGGLSSCTNRSGTDYYGRFDLAFPAVAFYLTGNGCAYTLSQTNQVFPASGGNSTNLVTVVESEDCGWTASSEVDWITITAGSSGNGDGSVRYTIAPNTGSRRAGMLWIAGHRVLITQYGANESCAPTAINYGQTIPGELSPSDCPSISIPHSSGDRFTFAGVAGKQISVALQSSAFDTFVTLIAPSGQVVARDDDEWRGDTNSRIPSTYGYYTLLESGTYTIEVASALGAEMGAYSLTLTGGCTLTITPTEVTFSALGNHIWEDFLTYTRQEPGCGAVSIDPVIYVPWINNLFDSYPKIHFNVMENTGRYPRIGTLTFGGIPITVRQRAYCNATNPPTLSATSKTVSPLGEDVSVNVSMAAGANCSWKMEQSNTWVTAQSNGGNGNGTAVYRVSRNLTTTTRSITLKIAGQDFTITQPGINSLCAVTPLTLGQTAKGTLASSDCRNATLQEAYADFYTFSGVKGQQIALEMKSSDFDVSFAVFDPAGNSSLCCSGAISSRQQRLPYEGYTDLPADGTYVVMVTSREPQETGNYTLSFAGIGGPGCSYQITPTNNTYLANSTASSFTLTVAGHCEWNVTSNVDWITFPESMTGSGGKEIKFNIAANPGARRSGAILVAGRYFSVAQDAPCTYVELSSTKATVRPVGGQLFSASVTTGSTCEWTYSGLPDWVQYQTSTTLKGDGYVQFNTQPNTGAFRSATLTIAGKPFVIEQWGGIQALVSAADYQSTVAPGSLVSIFGDRMLGQTATASGVPLPTELGGIRVNIYNATSFFHRCQILYVSPNQINFQLPDNVAIAPADLWLEDASGSFYSRPIPLHLQIAHVAPALFSMTSDGKGLAAASLQRIKNGVSRYEQAWEPDGKGGFQAKPIDLSDETEQVYLLLYGTGIRKRSDVKAVSANIGGTNFPVEYAGAQGDFVGLDQINVLLPTSLRGKGTVNVSLTADGKTSNVVQITIAP